MKEMSLDEAKQLCTEWQEILRMRDWQFDIQFVSIDEMKKWSDAKDEPPSVGLFYSSRTSKEHKRAVIFILEPSIWQTFKRVSQLEPTGSYKDIETTLVHEMIHTILCLNFVGLERDELDSIVEEQCICQIADALIKLKYPEVK